MSNTITQKQLNQIIGYGSIAVAAAILYGACCMVEDIINLGAQFRAYCDRLVEVSMGTQYRSNAIAGFVPFGLLSEAVLKVAADREVKVTSLVCPGDRVLVLNAPDSYLGVVTEVEDAPEFELQNEGFAIYSVGAEKQLLVWCGSSWGWQTYNKVGKAIIKHYNSLSIAKRQMKKLPESAYKSEAYVLWEFY